MTFMGDVLRSLNLPLNLNPNNPPHHAQGNATEQSNISGGDWQVASPPIKPLAHAPNSMWAKYSVDWYAYYNPSGPLARFSENEWLEWYNQKYPANRA